MNSSDQLFPVKSLVTMDERVKAFSQLPRLVWFTGLSGSGKSTLAVALEKFLFMAGYKVYLLDGDTIRSGINSDLNFSSEGRTENIRRVGELARLIVDGGLVVLAAFISPLRSHRELVKKIVGAEYYIEVFVDTPIEICEGRDQKQLYKKARQGFIENFTGINSPYEVPVTPDIRLGYDPLSQQKNFDLLCEHIVSRIKLI
ncbi:N/A [soil metagenome]